MEPLKGFDGKPRHVAQLCCLVNPIVICKYCKEPICTTHHAEYTQLMGTQSVLITAPDDYPCSEITEGRSVIDSRGLHYWVFPTKRP